MARELWKQMPAPFTRYDASTKGRVRSWVVRGKFDQRAARPRIMKPHQRPNGYQALILFTDTGQKKGMLVHRCVLFAWVGKCPEGWTGSHMNSKPSDNRIENLCFEPIDVNVKRQKTYDGPKSGVRGEKHYRAKLTAENVREIRAAYDAGTLNTAEVGRQLGVRTTTVLKVAKREWWKHLEAAA